MNTSNELLDLLHEIRDSQRELMGLTKTWKERSDRESEEWLKAKAESTAVNARWGEDNALWRNAYSAWLKESAMAPAISRTLIAMRLVTICLLAIIAASLWFK
jgi:hypothetical protein